jgi:hypothetical protein
VGETAPERMGEGSTEVWGELKKVGVQAGRGLEFSERKRQLCEH